MSNLVSARNEALGVCGPEVQIGENVFDTAKTFDTAKKNIESKANFINKWSRLDEGGSKISEVLKKHGKDGCGLAIDALRDTWKTWTVEMSAPKVEVTKTASANVDVQKTAGLFGWHKNRQAQLDAQMRDAWAI